MALSSNSLIHFTGSKDNLMGILKNNFKPYYCKERISVEDRYWEFYVPMVSFCDIPLSQLKDHIAKYGSYGIGLTKEWAVAQGLNPVLYIERGSDLAKSVDYASDKFVYDKEGGLDDLEKSERCVADVLRYIKNYEGKLNRGGKTIPGYRFSDEREWRYVPAFDNDFAMFISADYHDDESNKQEVDEDNLKLNRLRLSFEPNDITYLVIENENEISPFVTFLQNVKGKTYSYVDVQRLMTRILTTERIMSDM